MLDRRGFLCAAPPAPAASRRIAAEGATVPARIEAAKRRDFVPILLDDAEIDGPADQRFERSMIGSAVGDIEPAIGKVANTRREPEPEQITKTKDVFGHAARVGVVFLDGERGFVMEKTVKNMESFACIGRNDF
jgi:hypothetical protein